jgi:hypothetical protein
MSQNRSRRIISALLTRQQLSDILGRSITSTYRDELMGRIPPSVGIGNKRYWRRSDIERFLAAGCPAVEPRAAR